MSHISDNPPQTALPFRLSGSQAKTAFALRQNVENMISGNAHKVLKLVEYPCGTETKTTLVWVADKPENLHCVGFLTLTVGDDSEDGFKQVWDAAEASRRINNLNRRVLSDLFEKCIIVTERHKSGAIHFHVVGILEGRPDIRTNFDFKAVKNRNYSSVSPALSALWAELRTILPKYGFGRAELTPIEKTGEAIAAYISKYIEKNLFNRTPDDKRKKLVRYLGWNKTQLKPNDFSWGTKHAIAWRCKARSLAARVGITEKEDMKEAFGEKWAYKITVLMTAIEGGKMTGRPFFIWDYKLARVARNELAKLNESWCIRRDKLKIKRGQMDIRDIRAHTVWFKDKFPENFSTANAVLN